MTGKIGVLNRQPESERGSSAFIIPKADHTVRFLAGFREVNIQLICTPFPIPKISSDLQDMEGFTFATTIDLNRG